MADDKTRSSTSVKALRRIRMRYQKISFFEKGLGVDPTVERINFL